MESTGILVFAAWAGALAPPALWIYARKLTSRTEIHVVFAVAATLCAINILTSWLLLKSFPSDILEIGATAVTSLIGTIGVGRISFNADRAGQS